jgi:HK97 family phage major capsid protein
MDMKSMKMSPVELQAGIDQCLSKMDLLVATAKSEGRDFSEKERAEFDTVESEARLLNATRDRKQKSDEIQARVDAGEFPNVPDFLRSGGGSGGSVSQLRSRSGKPIAVARGPKERLSKSKVTGHLIGELARAAAIGCTSFTPDAVRAELRSDDNSKGGYAVPDLWLTSWLDQQIEMMNVAQYCTRQIMDSESLNVTTIEGRPTLALKGQLDSFASTGIVFGSRRLQAFTAGGVMMASLEMLEDAPNAAAQIEAVSARAMADWFNDQMLNGSGSNGEPLGILERDDLPETGSIGVPNWADVAAAWTALRQECYTANALVCSPAVYNLLHLQRELTAGDGGFLPRPEHLKDLNVVPSSHCPNSKLVIADFTQLILGIRQGARIEVSPHGEAFEKNAVSIRLKVRADWVPADLSAFRILSGITLT